MAKPRPAEHGGATRELPPAPIAEVRPRATGIEPETSGLDLGFDGVPTRLGGVLYLIHVALAFELFDACDDDLGAWAMLERLARALVPDADPDDDLWPALAQLDGRPPRVTPATAAPAAARLAELLPAIRERLAAALGDPSDDAVAELVACPGRLYVTASHVDLVAALDAISLPARRAGLDRDPGWVPALGRVVTFHFQDPAP